MMASFGTSREPAIVVMMATALDSKGRAWDQLGDSSEAVYAYDQALELFATVQTSELDLLVADTMVRKGSALVQDQKPSEAVAAFDEVIARFVPADAPNLVAEATSALLSKAAALLLQGKPLADSDFSLLLDCLAREGELAWHHPRVDDTGCDRWSSPHP